MTEIKLSETLKPLFTDMQDYFHLSNILSDEEYIDENDKPLLCYHCDSENIEKFEDVEFKDIPEKYQEQLQNMYANVKDLVITYWVCKDCDEVVAFEKIERGSKTGTKIYYCKYDSFNNIISFLRQKKYLNQDLQPSICWHCGSEAHLEHNKKENELIAECPDCKKILGKKFTNSWWIHLD